MSVAEPPPAPVSAALVKEAVVKKALADGGAAIVAFSGGVDSTYLLDLAHEVLGDRAMAVTADSPSLARSSLAEAEAFCRDRGIRHAVVATDEFERAEYLANDGQRCFHCKAALLRAMDALERATRDGRGPAALLIGAIADDLADYRPGMRAAAQGGARWPLAAAGFTKDEVRQRSRERGLPTWNRAAEPCLSSRVPYGEAVSPEALRMIESAEAVLKRHGFATCRARHHRIGAAADASPRGWLCRIEVPVDDLPRAVAARATLVPAIRACGYAHVALDLAGFASGGFNALLTPAQTGVRGPKSGAVGA